MSRLFGDVRWAWRQATHRPLAAGATVATLAGAVAAVTVATGLATAVLWRPLPFVEPERVVLVWEDTGDGMTASPLESPAAALPTGATTPRRSRRWRSSAPPGSRSKPPTA